MKPCGTLDRTGTSEVLEPPITTDCFLPFIEIIYKLEKVAIN